MTNINPQNYGPETGLVNILGFSYNRQLIVEKIFNHVNDSLFGKIDMDMYIFDILGVKCTRTFKTKYQTHCVEFNISIDDSKLFTIDYPVHRYTDDAIMDDICPTLLREIQHLKQVSCSCCYEILYTITNTTYCTLCVNTLDKFNVRGKADTTDNCVICQSEIGTYNVGAFKCGRHIGHVRCISLYNRQPNSHFCPLKCDDGLPRRARRANFQSPLFNIGNINPFITSIGDGLSSISLEFTPMFGLPLATSRNNENTESDVESEMAVDNDDIDSIS